VQAMPENFKYFFAYYQDTLCGATIVYCKDGTAYDFLMATHIDFWKYQPNNILLNSAILWSKSRGFTLFDLMGGRKGVFNFKSSFSDQRRNFYVGQKNHHESICSDLDQLTRQRMGTKYDPAYFPGYRQLGSKGIQ
jgi:lipid II:glycine glycyltransferase (peptidoglycan interpeptide bridge formation enzyme)